VATKIKSFEHKNQTYEIKKITRSDNTEFLTVYKGNSPFLPFSWNIDSRVDAVGFASWSGEHVVDYLVQIIEVETKRLIDENNL